MCFSYIFSVGLVYDETMKEHICQWDQNFPEKPERLTLSYERCQHYGLVDRCVLIEVGLNPRCCRCMHHFHTHDARSS